MTELRQVPKRLMDALDRGDVGTFLRYWAALPREGRPVHPMSFFVWAAINELAAQRLSGAQWFASDQREAKLACGAENGGWHG